MMIVFIGGAFIGYICGAYRGAGYVTWLAGYVVGYGWGRYRLKASTKEPHDG